MKPLEKLVPLTVPPGLFRNGTKYQSKGRWYDANLVRFHAGIIMAVGGWRNVTNVLQTSNIQLSDTPRVAHSFRADSQTAWLAVGGPNKLYAFSDGVLTDITIAGLTTGQLNGGYTTGGYGTGLYGAGYYGSGGGAQTLKAADTWQLDNFGSILVACLTSDGRILQSSPMGSVATVVTNAPTQCTGVVVTPERFLVALGASGDSRQIAWASQGTLTTWTPIANVNSAGTYELTTKGRIVAGSRTRNQTLVWTDVDVYAMTYVGGPLVYAVQQVGDGCGLIAPNAKAILGDIAYWMSYGRFCSYGGTVVDVPCDVLEVIFPMAGAAPVGTQLNQMQRSKVVCIPNTLYHEIWWFYPSMLSTGEPDRYVVYNYMENHWTTGALKRNAGVDRGAFEYPVMLDASGFLYEHEIGTAMLDSPTGSVTQVPFLESGPLELANAYGPYMMPTQGDTVFRIERMLPDEKSLGDLQTTIFTAINPTDAELVFGPFPHLAPTAFRVSARQMRLRYDQINPGWRLGVMRLGLIPGGLR